MKTHKLTKYGLKQSHEHTAAEAFEKYWHFGNPRTLHDTIEEAKAEMVERCSGRKMTWEVIKIVIEVEVVE
jgi:hypothetical protein